MKKSSPPVARNRLPILHVLQAALPPQGELLELAAGTGEHAVFLAPHFPGWRWQPTDIDPEALASIAAWQAELPGRNLLPARRFDVMVDEWPAVDAILAINLLHISPIEVSQALFAGAAHALRPGGLLYTYGPYRLNGAHTAPSNVEFDQWLQSRDPRYGVRDLGELEELAGAVGLRLEQRIAMPANNFSLLWRSK